MAPRQWSRRSILRGSVIAGGAWCLAEAASGQTVRTDKPLISHGVQSGDPDSNGAILWARADRAARLIIEVDGSDRFADPLRIAAPDVLEDSDFTARVRAGGLPPGREFFFRITPFDLLDGKSLGEPAIGRFRTAPAVRRDISFVWSGDCAGQGWGIDRARGGMAIFETMRRLAPDFFLHCGDVVYADVPLPEVIDLPDGTVWRNVMTPEKAKVAETLDEFRGQYKYNLLDDNLRRFAAEVPIVAIWDDHEVLNNWYPAEFIDDARYSVKSVPLLAARARRAFAEYVPMAASGGSLSDGMYRVLRYGPLLDVFLLDCRAFRAANGPNREAVAGPPSAFLGERQCEWLKRELLASGARWKILACSQPIGVVIGDGPGTFDGIANADDGRALGRELEIADLLRFMKANRIRNTVWLTADVHYTAAHYYDPGRARTTDFEPFWEFVSGPLHAGTFGPRSLDGTFGPQLLFQRSADGGINLSPALGRQFFGLVTIDGERESLAVSLRDAAGREHYRVDLDPD